MKNLPLTILKIGGSCLTNKDSSQARLRPGFLSRMAYEIALSMRHHKSSMIVVHGGGGMTHPLLDYYHLGEKLKNGIISTEQEKNSAARIHVAMNELNNRVARALQDVDIPAWPIQTSAIAGSARRGLPRLFTEAIRVALKLGIVPVLHGDLVLHRKKGSRIFSGDAVACVLSRDLNAERLFFMSDVDGIYRSVRNIKRGTQPLEKLHITSSQTEKFILNRIKGIDHSGGMREKIRYIKSICSHAQVRIFNGLVEGNIHQALQGESIGTEVIY